MRSSVRAVVAALMLTLLAAACGDGSSAADEPEPNGSPSPVAGDVRTSAPTEAATAPATEFGTAPATESDNAVTASPAGCGPVEHPPVQGGSHLIGDAKPPGPYSSTPPTSGWHSSGAVEVRIHDEADPIGEPQQVSVLEADGVVITHRDLPPDEQGSLEELVRERYDGKVAVTPYEKLERGEIALTAWGALQRCMGLDIDAITGFVEAHAARDVEPGHQQ